MNFEDMLLESTYDLSFTKNIINFILEKTKGKKQSFINRTFDITHFIPENYNPYNRKILFYTSVSSKQHTSTVLEIEKKYIMFNCVLPYRLENLTKSAIERLVNHEITHILDFLRVKKSYNISDKKYKRYNLKDNDLPYRNSELEFNVIINSILKYKREYPKSWKTITTYSKLLSILDNSGFFLSHSKHLEKDIKFKKNLLTRLVRENLLPPNFLPEINHGENKIGEPIFDAIKKYKNNYPNSWKLITNYSKLETLLDKIDITKEEKFKWKYNKTRNDLINSLKEQNLLPPNFNI